MVSLFRARSTAIHFLLAWLAVGTTQPWLQALLVGHQSSSILQQGSTLCYLTMDPWYTFPLTMLCLSILAIIIVIITMVYDLKEVYLVATNKN